MKSKTKNDIRDFLFACGAIVMGWVCWQAGYNEGKEDIIENIHTVCRGLK